MPTPRWCPSASVINGKIYVMGGSINESNGLSVVEEYDPTTDTWTEKADMPTARWYFSTSTVDGKIYAIGGNIGGNNYTSSVEEYDPNAEAVESKEKLPTTWGETKSH